MSRLLLAGTYRKSVGHPRKKTHHNKISSKQMFAIREIEKVTTCRFKGKTRYEAMIFISCFIKDKTIYPEGLWPRQEIESRLLEASKGEPDVLRSAED